MLFKSVSSSGQMHRGRGSDEPEKGPLLTADGVALDAYWRPPKLAHVAPRYILFIGGNAQKYEDWLPVRTIWPLIGRTYNSLPRKCAGGCRPQPSSAWPL